jgi:hypothetical protein
MALYSKMLHQKKKRGNQKQPHAWLKRGYSKAHLMTHPRLLNAPRRCPSRIPCKWALYAAVPKEVVRSSTSALIKTVSASHIAVSHSRHVTLALKGMVKGPKRARFILRPKTKESPLIAAHAKTAEASAVAPLATPPVPVAGASPAQPVTVAATLEVIQLVPILASRHPW